MKKLAFFLGAVAAFSIGSTASADNYFVCMAPLDRDTSLELGVIQSDADGIVEIYDYRLGEQGALLGTAEVRAGANADVQVMVDKALNGDVMAMLKIGGETVATKIYDVCDVE